MVGNNFFLPNSMESQIWIFWRHHCYDLQLIYTEWVSFALPNHLSGTYSTEHAPIWMSPPAHTGYSLPLYSCYMHINNKQSTFLSAVHEHYSDCGVWPTTKHCARITRDAAAALSVQPVFCVTLSNLFCSLKGDCRCCTVIAVKTR